MASAFILDYDDVRDLAQWDGWASRVSGYPVMLCDAKHGGKPRRISDQQLTLAADSESLKLSRELIARL
jgi:hypothetical protein